MNKEPINEASVNAYMSQKMKNFVLRRSTSLDMDQSKYIRWLIWQDILAQKSNELANEDEQLLQSENDN